MIFSSTPLRAAGFNCMAVEVSFRWCRRHGAAAVKVRGVATISWQGLFWLGMGILGTANLSEEVPNM